jgi:hypothetical protein
MAAKRTAKILKKMGRVAVTPDELVKFKAEKNRRAELRRQIVDEVLAKELTFKPKLNVKSKKITVRVT